MRPPNEDFLSAFPLMTEAFLIKELLHARACEMLAINSIDMRGNLAKSAGFPKRSQNRVDSFLSLGSLVSHCSEIAPANLPNLSMETFIDVHDPFS